MGIVSSVIWRFARRAVPGVRDVVFGLAAAAAVYFTLKPDATTLAVLAVAFILLSYSLRLMLRVFFIWWRLRRMRKAVGGIKKLFGGK